jgi:hypothetical protein
MSAKFAKCVISLDNFGELGTRLQALRVRLASLARFSSSYCKLCSSVGGKLKGHTGGCPSIFNHCFKCIGKHEGSKCTEGYFQLPSGVCWCCWLPLQTIFGFTFHNNDIGSKCSNPAQNLLKAFCILFYHDRQVAPDIPCQVQTKQDYGQWLFKTSSAGEGQLPNVCLLLEAALLRMQL